MKNILLLFMALFVLTANAQESKTITVEGVDYNVIPMVTAKALVDGSSNLKFSFATNRESDVYAIDFGNGELQTVSVKNKNISAKVYISNVALGEGNITIYANEDVAYFGLTENNTVRDLDLSKLTNVEVINVAKTAVSSVDVSKATKLTSFTFKNSKLTSLDLRNNTALTDNGLYVNDNELKSLILPANNSLTTISCQNNNLEELDLTSSTKLQYLTARENKLKYLDLSHCPELITITVNDNILDSINMTNVDKATTVILKNNNISKIIGMKTDGITTKLNVENNKLSFTSIPDYPVNITKAKNFTYAPQAPYEVVSKITSSEYVLDLTSQLYAKGILESDATTSFSFVKEDGSALVKGTDYFVIAPGKFNFLSANANIHGVLENEAYPLFTSDNAFVTTSFNVTEGVVTNIVDMCDSAADGKIYTLQGIQIDEISAPGIYIKNGKKYIVK
ncbi:MAG: hypothetical protein K6E54_00180 [Bacteroidaceae bacterium]|nr:hypothetical protein [Bacteroidaceae bacterium]